MHSVTKDLQQIVEQYRAMGQPWPATAREVSEWAIQERIWQPSRTDQISQLTDRIARAMSEEFMVDPQGRSVRAKRSAKIWRNGQLTGVFWDDVRSPTMTREFMEISVQNHRQQIVGECAQLKTDVDSYNDNFNSGPPINLVLDFTDDVAEREAVEELSPTTKKPRVAA